MKVAIFSDLHDSLDNLKIFLDWVKENKIEKLIFCGDLCRLETLEYLADNFSKEILFTNGNGELFYPKDVARFKNITYGEKKLEFKLDRLRVLITHKPTDLKKYLEEDNNFDFAFHGHTHKPWMNKENGLIIANPGTLGSSSGPISSFALLDTETGNLELKTI